MIKLHNAIVERGDHVHMTQQFLGVDNLRLHLIVAQFNQEHRVWNKNEIHAGDWIVRWRQANERVIDSFEYVGSDESLLRDLTYLKLADYI